MFYTKALHYSLSLRIILFALYPFLDNPNPTQPYVKQHPSADKMTIHSNFPLYLGKI